MLSGLFAHGFHVDELPTPSFVFGPCTADQVTLPSRLCGPSFRHTSWTRPLERAMMVCLMDPIAECFVPSGRSMQYCMVFSRTGRHWPTSKHPHGFVGGPARYLFPLSVCESFLQLAIIESWRCEPVGACSFDVAFATAPCKAPPHGVETEHSVGSPPTTLLCQNRMTPIFGLLRGKACRSRNHGKALNTWACQPLVDHA